MRYGPKSFLRHGAAVLVRGPVGIVIVEDEVEVASTLRHDLDRGSSPGLRPVVPADRPVQPARPGPFAWHLRQQLDFGLREPGQWF